MTGHYGPVVLAAWENIPVGARDGLITTGQPARILRPATFEEFLESRRERRSDPMDPEVLATVRDHAYFYEVILD